MSIIKEIAEWLFWLAVLCALVMATIGAWIQHFIHHLSPTGVAGFVMANGSMSTNTKGEGEIRQKLVENDLATDGARRCLSMREKSDR